MGSVHLDFNVPLGRFLRFQWLPSYGPTCRGVEERKYIDRLMVGEVFMKCMLVGQRDRVDFRGGDLIFPVYHLRSMVISLWSESWCSCPEI